ncbi:MAG: MaoC family dehydratase, partial [Kordiimonadaceae bacterium]|nr:MaoC family dehydratase [Kordiimonadaceae bacterium]
YAAASRFKQRIAHGALASSFISAVLGTGLPGLGTIYMTQSVRFLRPIHLDDKVETIVTVTICDTDKNRVSFDTSCYVKDKKVVEGEAMVYVPSRPEVLS